MQISIDNVVENFFDGSRELALTVTSFAVAKSLTLTEGGDRGAGRHRCCHRRRNLLPRLRQSLRL